MSSDIHVPKPIAQTVMFFREMRLRVVAEVARHEDHLIRERNAEYKIRQFEQGVTGPGVMLSRIAGSPVTEDGHPISGFLSERRDTQNPDVVGAKTKRRSRVIFFKHPVPSATSLQRWENEGGAICRPRPQCLRGGNLDPTQYDLI